MSIASHSIFWILTLVVFAAILMLFKSVLFPFILGATIAYLLNPLVSWVCKKGMNRQATVVLILVSFLSVMGIVMAIVIPILFREASGFVSAAPDYAERVWTAAQPWIDTLREKMGYKITDQLQVAVKDNIGKTLSVGKNVLGGLASSIAVGGQAIAGFVATLFLTPIVAFFMMTEWPRITDWVYGLIPRHMETTVRDLLAKIDTKIAGFIRGQVMVCFILGMMYAIALSVAGLNYGFFIGLGTGLLAIIPYAGGAIGLLTSLVVAGLQTGGDLTYIGIIAAIFFVGQFIEGNFISPKLIGDSVGLHPLWIIFALMAGGSLLGLVGMFLAVPVAAIISVLLAFAITQYKASPYYLSSPAADQSK